MNSHERYIQQILTEIEGREELSQRSLASGLGIALGLTNLLLRRLVRKGWVRVIRIKPNRVRYLLTPQGLAEKTRMSRLFLQDSVRYYLAARDRIRASLAAAALEERGRGSRKRVVFYGTGELAEIAFICLQETDLILVGVIGESGGRQFFRLPVHSVGDLSDGFVGATPFDRLVVTSSDDLEATSAQLEARQVAPERVHWL